MCSSTLALNKSQLTLISIPSTFNDMWNNTYCSPVSPPLVRPYPGFLKEHTPCTLFQFKHITPSNKETHSPFLSESPKHSICYTLSLILLSKLCFHFLLTWIFLLSCVKPRTLLAGPVGHPLGPQTQPAYVSFVGFAGPIHVTAYLSGLGSLLHGLPSYGRIDWL